MLIMEAGNIKKFFSDRLIIEFDGLKVYTGDKIGIVGVNGSGKTTLLNILSKNIEPDEGYVRLYSDIAYIRQFSEEKIEADPKLLKEFNLSQKTDQSKFSGGENTRIKIANAFSSDELLLFADEPTSNLDFKGIELLKQKLSLVDSFMLISHDRQLLDSLCNKIIEVKDGKLKIYSGNYSFYKEMSDVEHENAWQDYEKYVDEKNGLENAIKDRKGRSKAMKKAPSRMGNSEARLHKREANERMEKLHKAANSLKTRLEKLEVKEKPRELQEIKLDFSMTNPPENRIVISSDKLDFGYGSRKIFDNAVFKIHNGKKTAIWGENGAGKTTLLNLINDKASDGIYIVPKARIGYFQQGFENLDLNKSVLENVMVESVQTQTVTRTILARLLISGDDVYKKVDVLSGGERIKVAFAKLFVSKANVLLLDEPTNYLDMMSIEALEGVLREYEGTVLFISHDKTFVNAVADIVLVIENKAIKEFEGGIEAYEASAGRQQASAISEMDKMLIQMRITEVLARLSKNGGDNEALEIEYQSLLAMLKQ